VLGGEVAEPEQTLLGEVIADEVALNVEDELALQALARASATSLTEASASVTSGSRLGHVDRMLSGMCHEAGKSMMKGGRGLTAS
jgi:hypothetical protein